MEILELNLKIKGNMIIHHKVIFIAINIIGSIDSLNYSLNQGNNLLKIFIQDTYSNLSCFVCLDFGFGQVSLLSSLLIKSKI